MLLWLLRRVIAHTVGHDRKDPSPVAERGVPLQRRRREDVVGGSKHTQETHENRLLVVTTKHTLSDTSGPRGCGEKDAVSAMTKSVLVLCHLFFVCLM